MYLNLACISFAWVFVIFLKKSSPLRVVMLFSCIFFFKFKFSVCLWVLYPPAIDFIYDRKWRYKFISFHRDNYSFQCLLLKRWVIYSLISHANSCLCTPILGPLFSCIFHLFSFFFMNLFISFTYAWAQFQPFPFVLLVCFSNPEIIPLSLKYRNVERKEPDTQKITNLCFYLHKTQNRMKHAEEQEMKPKRY